MIAEPCPRPLELWAGVECTVNRVGNVYFDQLERSGHARRAGDLERIASLGVRTLRYPLLWERTVREGGWRFGDERLPRLAALGIRPIVGLLHHGSGPPGTSLLAPEFPGLLSGYARSVARRYPWVEAYTPINEPLTTARFSALYGHWYPHARDAGSFALATLLQCRAIVLAMRAVREVNPAAILVQTEDMGEVRATAPLAYQAGFENHRRWLTFDLLCGRVDRHHPLWHHLHGVNDELLQLLLDEPCPPDVIGLNYYVTSDRWLDHRLELYPERLHGGNGRHRYADVEAVRVCPDGLIGIERILEQAWRRYRRPLAVTEVHLAHPTEQALWLAEIWNGAEAASRNGADVRALTVWALFGAYDWHNLVTRDQGRYEPGVFDVSGAIPTETALAAPVRDLTAGRPPAIGGGGWWRRAERLSHRIMPTPNAVPEAPG
jgi:dTDP-4-dehydrorhamnose reductase